MARVKKTKEEVVEKIVEVVEVKKTTAFPVVVGNKKFQAVPHECGYLVYNPSGERVSGILTKDKADDTVRNMNKQAGLK